MVLLDRFRDFGFGVDSVFCLLRAGILLLLGFGFLVLGDLC